MSKESEICKRIKEFRKKQGFTLQQLAHKTGFSQGYLSKVENSKMPPPVSTLIRLANSLNVTVSAILGEVGNISTISLVKKNQGVDIVHNGVAFGYTYQSLAYKFINRKIDPYFVTLPKDPVKMPFFKHEGEEVIYVLEGKMKIYHGEIEFIAEEGDCIYLNASIPHFSHTYGDKEAKCLVVFYVPPK